MNEQLRITETAARGVSDLSPVRLPSLACGDDMTKLPPFNKHDLGSIRITNLETGEFREYGVDEFDHLHRIMEIGAEGRIAAARAKCEILGGMSKRQRRRYMEGNPKA